MIKKLFLLNVHFHIFISMFFLFALPYIYILVCRMKLLMFHISLLPNSYPKRISKHDNFIWFVPCDNFASNFSTWYHF